MLLKEIGVAKVAQAAWRMVQLVSNIVGQNLKQIGLYMSTARVAETKLID